MAGHVLWRRRTIRPDAFRAGIGSAALAAPLTLVADPAAAANLIEQFATAFGSLTATQVIFLSLFTGVVSFAIVAVIASLRARNQAIADNSNLREETADLSVEIDRAEALLGMTGDRVVAWEGSGRAPVLLGTLSVPGVPEERGGFLAFGTWLAPDSAAILDRSIAILRSRGEGFSLAVSTQSGHGIDILGKTVGGRALVRFRSLTSDRLALATLQQDHHLARRHLEALQAALDQAPTPFWVRDEKRKLAWVNRAYAVAVEAETPDEAVERGLDLFDMRSREAIAAAHAKGEPFSRRQSTVVAGERRVFDMVDAPAGPWSAGAAVDATALDEAEAANRRLADFHARTLDQLATAVAIFGADRRLQSYNAAYRDLFSLDPAFLDSGPEEGEILERLRTARKLPDQADFRKWRANLLSAYRSDQATEHFWQLADGRALRVLANPHPQGGMIWIYENVTEKLELESRHNALVSVQRETLDHLSEAVAVFGSDGRLRLHNPPLATIWSLSPKLLAERPHVARVIEACRSIHDEDELWRQMTTAIAGLDESRGSLSGRIERLDGKVIDYATVPLPDGQTMVTFVDITDTVKVERALTDRNEALEAANGLKNAFVQHVSYELRSPLTNIIGFTHLLAAEKVGPLNERQREYTGYILASSDALLALVDDILDLATLDAGIMSLDLGPVDIGAMIRATVQGLRDRIDKANLTLDVSVPDGIGDFVADERRLKQILFNLLSNAVAFSNPGGRVAIAAERRASGVVFSVEDNGGGMPESYVPSAFERFESRPSGTSRGGPGLGLPIVKSLTELHGGTVAIRSKPGEGTVVTVALPLRPAALDEAAE